MKRINACVTAVILALAFCAPVLAAYPEKPITMNVGFKAGGVADTIARVLGKALQAELGQPVVVVNNDGGGGTKAAGMLKKAKPDGYQIAAVASSTFSFTPHFLAAQKRQSYKVDDFTYLATVAEFQVAWVGPPSINDWESFIALAREKSNGASVASLSPLDAMIIRYIAKKEGVTINPVPYKGGAGAMAALLGGHTDIALSGGLHFKYVKAGQMKVLAVPTAKRLAAHPDAPTLIELGYGISAGTYVVLALPKGTPADIVNTLEQALSKAVNDESYTTLMGKMSIPVEYRGPKETEELISEQSKSLLELFKIIK
jgi:tripartite-type tricarboxylate transporter receptor subunit TctC